MKKFTLSAVVIISFILYGKHHQSESTALPLGTQALVLSTALPTTRASDSPTPTDTPTSTPTSTVTTTTAPTPIPTATQTHRSTPSPSPSGKFKNGNYTGIAADAYYGYVQVQAVVQNGKLTAVNILQYPNDRSYSVQVNSYALPILQQEAIQAQSAQVNAVSGASDSSQAFIQSLTDALKQA